MLANLVHSGKEDGRFQIEKSLMVNKPDKKQKSWNRYIL